MPNFPLALIFFIQKPFLVLRREVQRNLYQSKCKRTRNVLFTVRNCLMDAAHASFENDTVMGPRDET